MSNDQATKVRRQNGEISAKGLAKILADLRTNRRVTTLLVARGATEKVFYFTIGAVRLCKVGEDQGLKLGAVLLGRRLLNPDQLRAVEAARIEMRVPLKNDDGTDAANPRMISPLLEDVISQQDLVPRQDLHDAVAEVVRWELEEVFFWEDGSYTIWDGNPPLDIYSAEGSSHKMSFGVPKMLEEIEGAIERRGQREARVLLGRNAVRMGTPSADASSLDRAIFDALRAPGTTVLDLVRAGKRAGVKPFDCAVRLLELEARNALSIQSSPPPLTRPALQNQNKSIEESLERLLDGIAATRQLADGYQALGEVDKSIEFRRMLADKLISGGSPEDALSELNKILSVADKDFPTYERVLGVLEQLNRRADLIKLARHYAGLLMDVRLFNRARRAWNYLIGLEPRDVPARRELVKAHLQLRDKAAAANELRNVAKIEEERGDDSALAAAYVDILKVDPNNAEVIEAYKRLTGFYRARTSRRLLAVFMSLVLACGGFLALYVNLTAREYVHSRNLALEKLEAREFRDADELLGGFLGGRSGLFVGFIIEEAKATRDAVRRRAQNYYEARFYSTTGEAEWRKRHHDLPTALDSLAALDAELRKATDELCPKKSAWLSDISQRRSDCIGDRTRAENDLAAAKDQISKGQYQSANAILLRLFQRHRWLTELASAELPIKIETTPPGAEILLSGRAIASAPGTALIPMRNLILGSLELVVSLPGYEQTPILLDDVLSWPTIISLRKRAAWTGRMATAIDAPVAVDGDVAAVGDRGGLVSAFSLKSEDPQPTWSRELGLGADVERLVLGPGILCVLTGDRRVHGLDPNTGAPLWVAPARLVGPVIANLGSAGRVALHGDVDGELVARRTDTGAIVWRKIFGGGLSGSPLVIGTQIYVPARNGRLGIMSLQDGAISANEIVVESGQPLPSPVLFRRSETSIELVLALESGKVCFVSIDQEGRSKVESLALNVPLLGLPVLVGDRMLVTTAEDRNAGLVVIDPAARAKMFREDLKTSVTGELAISATKIYVPVRNGLIALNRETCRPLWHFETRDPIRSRPHPLKSYVFTGLADGRLLAIEE